MDYKINEQQVGSSLKLNCVMSVYDSKTAETTSRQFTVNDLAVVHFKFEFSGNQLKCFITAQTLTEPKDFLIKLKVQCHGQYSDCICTDDSQSQYTLIGKMNPQYMDTCCKMNYVRSVQFIITISTSKVLNGLPVKLYNDEDFTDFQLNSSDGSVPIHRTYLAAHSDVFKTMLSREWKETKEGRIQIEGVTLQTLQHLKRYMYLGDLPSDGLHLQSLLLVASCYMMEDLKAECVLKLTQTVKPEELYSLIKFAFENECPELMFALMKETPVQVVEDAENIHMKKKVAKEREDK